LGQGHDGSHALVDGEGVGLGLFQYIFKYFGEDEGIDDKFDIGLQIGAPLIEIFLGLPGASAQQF